MCVFVYGDFDETVVFRGDVTFLVLWATILTAADNVLVNCIIVSLDQIKKKKLSHSYSY